MVCDGTSEWATKDGSSPEEGLSFSVVSFSLLFNEVSSLFLIISPQFHHLLLSARSLIFVSLLSPLF